MLLKKGKKNREELRKFIGFENSEERTNIEVSNKDQERLGSANGIESIFKKITQKFQNYQYQQSRYRKVKSHQSDQTP